MDYGEGRGGGRGGGFSRGRSGGFGRDGGGGFRRSFGPREMHKIKCSECGKDAEVPFKPREGTPVYCRDCFFKRKGISQGDRPAKSEEKDEKSEEDESEDEEETESEEQY